MAKLVFTVSLLFAQNDQDVWWWGKKLGPRINIDCWQILCAICSS